MLFTVFLFSIKLQSPLIKHGEAFLWVWDSATRTQGRPALQLLCPGRAPPKYSSSTAKYLAYEEESKSPVTRLLLVYIYAQSSNNLIPRLTNHVSAQFLQGQMVLVHLYCAPLAPGLEKVPQKLTGSFKGGNYLSMPYTIQRD